MMMAAMGRVLLHYDERGIEVAMVNSPGITMAAQSEMKVV